MSVKLDEADRKILRAIQANPDITMRDLGEVAGLSHSPCWRRLKRMQDAGVIDSKRYVLDPQSVGFEIVVFCFVHMKEHTRDQLNAFEAAVARVPEVLQCYLVTGDHDYVLRVLAQDMRHYEAVVKNSLVELPNVSMLSTSVTMKEVINTTDVPV